MFLVVTQVQGNQIISYASMARTKYHAGIESSQKAISKAGSFRTLVAAIKDKVNSILLMLMLLLHASLINHQNE